MATTSPYKNISWIGERTKDGFPSHDIPNDEKRESWILSFVKQAWEYTQANCPNIFFFNRGRYKLISSYAQGTQSTTFYQTQMGISPSEDDSYININWEPFPALSVLRNSAVNKANNVGYKMNVFPLNPLSDEEKSKWYADQKARLIIKEFLESSNPKLSNLINQINDTIKQPADQEELDLISGFSYKSIKSEKIKSGIDLVFQENKIDKAYKLWDKDIIDYGVCIGKTDIDSNGNILIKRCHPENFISSFVNEEDFSDMYYGGEVVTRTIQSLRQEAQDYFDESQYKDISKRVAGTAFGGLNVSSQPDILNRYPYDNQIIQILDFEFSTNWWIGKEPPEDQESKRISERKEDTIKENKYSRKQIEVWFRCKWIIGTDYIYDFGLKNNMIRPKESLSNARSSFRVLAPGLNNMRVVSRVERAMTLEDQICLTWYKFQNELARVIPSGWAIDESAFENIIIQGGQGGAITTKKDMTEMFVQTGILRYRSENLRGEKAGKIPIESLKNGLTPDVITYYNILNMHIKTLRMILGINDIATGEGGADRTNKEGLQMMYEASDIVLTDVTDARKNMLEMIAKDVICRLQDVLKVKDIEGYVQSLGKNVVKFIRLDKTLSRDLFGIKIEDKPDTEKKLKLESAINDAYAKQELDAADVFLIDSMDDMQQAYMYLAYKHKIFEKKTKELQLRNMQIELSVFSQKEQAKAQAEIMVIEAKAKSQIMQDENITKLNKMLQDDKYGYELKVAAMKVDGSLDKERISNQGKVQQQEVKNEGAITQKYMDNTNQNNNLV